MGKFDGVLLVSDYDDTLYNYNLEVSRGNRDAIRYFIQEGGHFSVATGRAYETFTPQITREHLEDIINAPVILSNGAAIYDYRTAEFLHLSRLPAEAPEHMKLVMKHFPALGFESYYNGKVYVYNPNLVVQRHLERVNVPFTICYEIDEMPGPWVKLILEQDHPLLADVQQFFLDHWANQYEAIFSNLYLLEITAKGNTKGALVGKLAQILGVQPQNIYCVGDNQNDIPMLAASAIPFAPANCAIEVRKWGAHIVNHCNEDAIADIISILDKRY